MAENDNHHIRWFSGEIPKLRAAGLLDDETAERLDRYYGEQLKKRSPRRFFLFPLAVLGILMIVAGIILAINHNWDDFTNPMRLAIGAVPLAVGFALSMITVFGDRRGIWREASAIVSAGGIATFCAVVSQVYHMAGELSGFMTLVLALSLPFVYIFNSTGLAVCYVLTLPMMNSWGDEKQALLFCIWMLAVTPFLLRHSRSASPDRALCRYLEIYAAVSAAIVCGGYFPALAATVVAVTFLYGGWHWREKHETLLRNPWLAGFLGVLAVLAIGSSTEGFFRIYSGNPKLPFWIFTGAVLAVNLFVYPRRHLDEKRLLTGLLVLLPFLCFIPGVQPWVMRLVFNIFMGAYGLVLLIDGYKRGKLLVFNGGMAMIALLAVCRFCDSDLGLLARSAGLIAIGLGFVIANIVFNRKLGK